MAISTHLFTLEEVQALEDIARRRGYSSAALYLRYLVDVDAAENDEPLVFDDDDDDERIREGIKQGMKDALKGDVLTEEEFLRSI